MRKSNLNSFKILLATAALALTLILWNLFSSQALAETIQKAREETEPSQQPDANALANLAPLPTLVPIQFELAANVDSPIQAVAGPTLQAAPTQTLRKVNAPTPAAVPQKPVVRQITINTGGGGGGGGGGGNSSANNGGSSAPAPAASTGSSKK